MVNAQVWYRPVLMATTPVVSPTAFTGTALSVVVPLPSCPLPLLPQHLIPPLVLNAQEWISPTLIAVLPLERPTTSTGIVLFVVVALPNCPAQFNPQHLASPLAVNAQV
jgi:hypothetical protein